MHAWERMRTIVGEDRTGETGCMLEKLSRERLGREGRDACLRAHANVTGGMTGCILEGASEYQRGIQDYMD
jgi:hypothetical protein